MNRVFTPHTSKVAENGCISIVGMAAAGKTTIGRELSLLLGWPQLDADNVIESTYGASLQNITDSMDKESFLDIEGRVIEQIRVCRTIISTGGSAVYRQHAIDHLQRLGPIIYISVPLPIIIERIARKPERGLAIAPGQTIEELYEERVVLYKSAATFTVEGGRSDASSYAELIAEWLETPDA